MPRGQSLEERFWSRVIKTDSCWVWQGARVLSGHGQIRRGARSLGNVLTHRLAWELAHGPIPEGLYLLHSCDNPPCVNPSHLRLGTAKENTEDWRERGVGIPVPRARPLLTKKPIEERFWERVEKTDTCWLWKGQKMKSGHGKIGTGEGDKNILAHRLSWTLYTGEVLDDPKVCVLHKCDNPPCVNPEHLFIGTQSDNMRDKVEKKRHKFGGEHKNSKLTEEQAKAILQRWRSRQIVNSRGPRNGPDSIGAIARSYGLDETTVYDLVKRRTWKHLE